MSIHHTVIMAQDLLGALPAIITAIGGFGVGGWLKPILAARAAKRKSDTSSFKDQFEGMEAITERYMARIDQMAERQTKLIIQVSEMEAEIDSLRAENKVLRAKTK